MRLMIGLAALITAPTTPAVPCGTGDAPCPGPWPTTIETWTGPPYASPDHTCVLYPDGAINCN